MLRISLVLALVVLVAACGGRTEFAPEAEAESSSECMAYTADEDVLAELLRAHRPPGAPRVILGNSKTLTSTGQLTTDPNRPQNVMKSLLEFTGPAAAYIVSTRGVIQKFLPTGILYPFGVFLVQWSIGGTSFQTKIDGYSDQFLVVYAEQVRIFAQWDFENADVAAADVMRFPQEMLLSASICPALGAETNARRTIILPAASPAAVAVPYAARGFIVRSLDPDYFGIVDLETQASGGQFIDRYTAADVAAAHSRGEYLSIASVTDFLFLTYAGPVTSNGFVEFLIRP